MLVSPLVGALELLEKLMNPGLILRLCPLLGRALEVPLLVLQQLPPENVVPVSVLAPWHYRAGAAEAP